ncbi:MAG TPA: hypothetical protein VN721_01015 [Flavipsychrobacter sp.]|nr:hypothetical protein [Flavipsychrobacter sp.]
MTSLFLMAVGNSDWYVLLVPVIILLAVFKAGEWYGERKHKHQVREEKEQEIHDVQQIQKNGFYF